MTKQQAFQTAAKIYRQRVSAARRGGRGGGAAGGARGRGGIAARGGAA